MNLRWEVKVQMCSHPPFFVIQADAGGVVIQAGGVTVHGFRYLGQEGAEERHRSHLAAGMTGRGAFVEERLSLAECERRVRNLVLVLKGQRFELGAPCELAWMQHVGLHQLAGSTGIEQARKVAELLS
jgi:hypothetical protein